MCDFLLRRRSHFDHLLRTLQPDLINLANPIDPITGRVKVPLDKTISVATIQSGPMRGHTRDERPDYGIYDNETCRVLANMFNRIENGGESFLTGSGRAALRLGFSLLPHDSHIIVTLNDLYPGTRSNVEWSWQRMWSRRHFCAGSYARCTAKRAAKKHPYDLR
jgi:cystathionine beta-lyase/cystathionine gamma-synthase